LLEPRGKVRGRGENSALAEIVCEVIHPPNLRKIAENREDRRNSPRTAKESYKSRATSSAHPLLLPQSLRRTPMTNVRIILVPVDFSEGSFAAVRHARDLADVFHSQIHLLHVSSAPDAPQWALELFAAQLRPIEDSNRMQALDRLATLIVSQRLDPLRTTGLVRSGAADEVIADYAEQIHADVIVMGLHGDHLIPNLRLGQVVERVLGRVDCPVLAIPEERTPTARVDRSFQEYQPAAC
jgi:nucleotide-binding universal stress UspA family protein